MNLTTLFKEFFKSEKASGFILVGCTLISLVVANSPIGDSYLQLLHTKMNLSFLKIDLDHSIEYWINDGLMAIFFLLVGLEIKRELYIGELSSFKNAILPVLAAIGGMVVPAFIHLCFNYGTETQPGFGIPMATDIAFALGILSLAGNRVPVSLKVFLAALAIIDDLGAIVVIAVFYTDGFAVTYFLFAAGIFFLLLMLNKLKVTSLIVYIIGGVIAWYCMSKSGVHPTIAGVLLAFALPFNKTVIKNPSFRLQHFLHKPVAFFILPVFALANTALILPANIPGYLATNNSLGIIIGLLAGKLIGILLVCYIAVKMGMANLPALATWQHMTGIALLAGIGFTMSIFITNLAFDSAQIITGSRMSILLASVIAAFAGLAVLRSIKLKNNE